MYLRIFRSAISDFNANADIVGISLRILDKYIEIAIVIEDAGID